MSQTFDEAFREAKRASESVGEERDAARARAVAAVRALEVRLKEAVQGDLLRGMSNLAGPFGPPFKAAAVSKTRHGVDRLLSLEGRPMTCVAQDGSLVRAWLTEGKDAHVERRALEDDEVLAEDLEPIALAVHEALARHVARSDRVARNYAKASELAQKLSEVLGFVLA